MTLEAPSRARTGEEARARAEWGRLARRLSTITPQAAARGVLALAVGGMALWLAIGTWPALLPFAIGATIAYAVLPLVNGLDAFMPRVLASLLAVLLVLAAVVAVFVIVVPPLAAGIGRLAQELPTREQLAEWLAGLQTSVGQLPGPAGPRLVEIIDELVAGIRASLQGSTGSISELAPAIIQGIIGAVAAALGLIVLPTWILTLVREQRTGRRTVFTRMPAWLRGDAWATIRILDRVGARYLRSGVLLGALVGGGVWLALTAANRLGLSEFASIPPVAVFAGAMQVIPEIGPFIGFLPALLLLPVSAERAVIYLVAYVGSRFAAGLIAPRLTGGRRSGLHPVILVPGIVALTQFGLIWLFLAGPLLAIVYDLVRYAHGRLSEPPRPAGVLPDEAVTTADTTVPTWRPAASAPRRAPVTTRG